MKRIFAFVLVSALVAGSLAAQAEPIGLKVYIDGFSFGNVAGEDYMFAGSDDDEGTVGEASINLGVEYAKTFGEFGLSTSLEYNLPFAEYATGPGVGVHAVSWKLKGAYDLALAEASALNLSAYNKLILMGAKLGKDGDFEFANTDYDFIRDEIAADVKFTQTLDFGTIWANLGVAFTIHTGPKDDVSGIDLATGGSDGFKVGVNTNMGVYGYVEPKLTFLTNGEALDEDKDQYAFHHTDIRIGYGIGNIDGHVTVGIPVYKDGFKAEGLAITPRFTYSNIIPGLEAYLDFGIGNIGAEEVTGGNDGKVAFAPTIGVSYAF
jgi:hypothetical protein